VCSCGRAHVSKDQAGLSTRLWRCQQQHFAPRDLNLATGEVKATNVLCAILTNKAAQHHHKKLKTQLLKNGVPRRNILVKNGAYIGNKRPKDLWAVARTGRPLKTNEICKFNFYHVLCKSIAEKLRANRVQRKCLKYAAVLYLEDNAVMEVPFTDVLSAVNESPKKITWLGQ
jgi:hypothetical protein